MKRSVLVLTCLFLCAGSLLAQWQKPYFARLSTNEGLSQSTVQAILKDSKGFMWFGTMEGLNKYDGYRFTIYKHDLNRPASLGNDIVYDLWEDKTGVIWVATGGGLDKYDRNSDSFTHCFWADRQLRIRDIFQDSHQRIWLGTTTGLYQVTPETNVPRVYKSVNSHNSLSDDFILKITEDNTGLLWIATQHGLNRLDPETGQFTHYFHDPKNPQSIGSDWVRALFVDQHQTLWIGTLGGGIARYNATTDSFTNFRHDAKRPASLGHNDVLSFLEDNEGNLWVGTENGGISVYHPGSNTFTTVRFDPTDANSLSNNSIYALYKDYTGDIWAGTYSGGVNFRPKFGKKFRLYRNVPYENSLSNNIVLSVIGDDDGAVWLGTDGGGLNLFDSKTGNFSVFQNQALVGDSRSSSYIITVINVEKNMLALGYHRNGFDLFDMKKRTFSHYLPGKGNSNDLPTSSVNVLGKDKNTNLWIGTWARGLFFYDRQSKQATQFLHNEADDKTLCDNHLNGIYEDGRGIIWLATENGLDAFDPKTRLFTHVKHNPRDTRTISSNTVNCILKAGPDHLWIGTAGGLCRLNIKNKTVEAITEKNGLPNNVINALIDDTKGNLWISTNRGICRYNPRTKAVRNYGIQDGLQGNEFKVGSAFRMADGMLIFGGTDGFNTFYPDRMPDNAAVPPVYMTDFQIFNKSVRIGGADSVLSKHINETPAITLNHDQNVFSIEFAALNYTLPEKNQYAYKLDGFDQGWNYAGTKRTATYTNLDPGNYTFRAKASNNDGVWNEQGATLTIRVLPPYWQTWWFRLLLAGLVTSSAFAFYQARVSVIRSQKWALEQIIEERTERLHQEQLLNKMKSQFVSTASHEFRTPLATIQSSVDLVGIYIDLPQERGKLQIQKHLRVVEKEISKFGNLLDDILTIEKMSAGKLQFSPQPANLLAICDEVIATYFQGRRDQRSVDVSTTGVPSVALLDEKLISQALINLLSNAFKFSTTNPALQVDFCEKWFVLSVTDQGIGIPQKDMPHLFETFFRAGNVATIQGTGLGLFITKQSIELHGGTIQVRSEEGVGTTFTSSLPIVHC